jgi:hypothetical protein
MSCHMQTSAGRLPPPHPSQEMRLPERITSARDVARQIAAEIGRDPHLVHTILQEQMKALLLEVTGRLDPSARGVVDHDVIQTAET